MAEEEVVNDLPKPGFGNPDRHIELYNPSEEELANVDTFVDTYPEFMHLEKGLCLRFLRAGGSRGNEFISMKLREHIEWLNQIKPFQLKKENVEIAAMNSGCWRYLGNSTSGCPVLWVRTELWNPHEYDVSAYENYVAFFSAQNVKQMITNTQQIVVFDMGGWSYWQGKYLSYIKTLIGLVQNHFPERLKAAVLINSPYIFHAVWAVICRWLDPITAKKISLVSGLPSVEATFMELDVPKEILPIRYGGHIEDEDNIPVPGYPNTE